MKAISRRQFILLSTALWLPTPLIRASASSETTQLIERDLFPITVAVLSSAYRSEIVAFEHYVGYSRKALEEQYPNIAYLFAAFAVSEKTHAENYKRILALMSRLLEEPEFEISISDTKANLINASKGELEKIQRTYPEFLAKLKKESHDQAVVHCAYSWKSHRQHKRKISEIEKYSKLFFGPVAKKIEGMNFDFHVCEICGSTLDKAPKEPCVICNYPILHYRKVKRPVSV
jgi:rubrerythrin